jgi:hypothetical protein
MTDTVIIRRCAWSAIVGLGAVLCSFAAAADQPAPAERGGDLDVTMRIITDPDAKLPDEIVRRITLPPPRPAPPAEDRSDEDRSTGLDRAEEAREQGRQFGQDVADSARDHAEEARRNANPPGRPDPGAPPEPVDQPAPSPAPGPGG